MEEKKQATLKNSRLSDEEVKLALRAIKRRLDYIKKAKKLESNKILTMNLIQSKLKADYQRI